MSEKSLRIQAVAHGETISIDTKDKISKGSFMYTAFFIGSKSIGYSMQANHTDPEWPEMRRALFNVAKALREVQKVAKEYE